MLSHLLNFQTSSEEDDIEYESEEQDPAGIPTLFPSTVCCFTYY
jgi:hypothetical protein